MSHQTKTSKHQASVFQGRLDFAAVAAKPRNALATEFPIERNILRGLYFAIIVLICLYLYFVSAAVLNVMYRREALTQINQIDASIGGLENQYFALTQEITPQAGASIGLVPVQDTNYVDRPDQVSDAGTIASTAI